MNPFLEGAIVGLTLAVLLGPAMFSLIQTSIHRGFRSGAMLAAGIFLSDLTLVFLCFMGAIQILSDDNNRFLFGFISGMILISYGIVALTRKMKTSENGDLVIENESNRFKYIFKGFFLNITNPFVWIFWMGLTVGVTSNYGEDTGQATMFFSGTLSTIILTDLLKVYVAKSIKSLLNPANIRHLNQLVGALLIGFGVVLIVRTVMNQYMVN
ncbi:MAG: LysE family transporter [Bacteroidales bacterium]|nr:LysE family transporter [Bacteroidales bacterium]